MPFGGQPYSITDQQKQLLARQQGLIPLSPQGQPSQPAAGQGASPINQVYGLLAQHANDPTGVGQNYISALQAEQRLNQQNDPVEKFLRLYGNVNPYDFEVDSLQKFQDNFVQTGNLQFDLLRRKDDLSTKEQGFLNDAITGAHKAQSDVGRMTDLSNRFMEQGQRGMLKGRLAGGISEWLKTMVGSEDEVSRLRTEYEQLRISNVVQNLPPGVASDKDVELVLRGWPAQTADPAYLASFLRGMQKLRAVDYARAAHGAAFLGNTRSQVGQLQDWEKNKDWLIEDAFRKTGLRIYNPGKNVSAEDAAQMRWNQEVGAAPVTKATPRAATRPAPSTDKPLKPSTKSLVDKYGTRG